MAETTILNFDSLLAPLGPEPSGVDLRADDGHDSPYRRLRDARSRARSFERQADAAKARAEWDAIFDEASDILSGKSKDYEVTAMLIEALVRKHGFAGLRAGLRLARELAERYWDDLHPRPDEEDGVQRRVGWLGSLSGEESEGALIVPIRMAPLLNGSAGTVSLADVLMASEIDSLEPEQRVRRMEEGAVTLEQFEQAVTAAGPLALQAAAQEISEAAAELTRLDAVLTEKCGMDESGAPLAPPLHNIRNVLNECRTALRRFLPEQPAIDAEANGAGDESGSVVRAPIFTGGGAGGMSRDEALQHLLRIADFFRRTEPHSPMSYAIEQVVRWGRMPLPNLWNELIPDEGGRKDVFKLVGIKNVNEEEGP